MLRAAEARALGVALGGGRGWGPCQRNVSGVRPVARQRVGINARAMLAQMCAEQAGWVALAASLQGLPVGTTTSSAPTARATAVHTCLEC